MRNLQDEEPGGEGTFDVEVILSEDEEVDGSPGFDVQLINDDLATATQALIQRAEGFLGPQPESPTA